MMCRRDESKGMALSVFGVNNPVVEHTKKWWVLDVTQVCMDIDVKELFWSLVKL